MAYVGQAGMPAQSGTLMSQEQAAKLMAQRPIPGNFKNVAYAMAATQEEIVAQMLQAGADPNAQDHQGKTALHHATWFQKNHIAKAIMRHPSIDLKMRDCSGESLTHPAAKAGNLEMLMLLVKAVPSLMSARDDDGVTPFIIAAQEDKTEICEYLYLQGVSIEEQDNHGRTALLWACYRGCLRAVPYLLSRAASIAHRDADGMTAFHRAVERDVIELAASERPNVDWLLKVGSVVLLDVKDVSGQTPISIAWRTGNIGLYCQLLSVYYKYKLFNRYQFFEQWMAFHVFVLLLFNAFVTVFIFAPVLWFYNDGIATNNHPGSDFQIRWLIPQSDNHYALIIFSFVWMLTMYTWNRCRVSDPGTVCPNTILSQVQRIGDHADAFDTKQVIESQINHVKCFRRRARNKKKRILKGCFSKQDSLCGDFGAKKHVEGGVEYMPLYSIKEDDAYDEPDKADQEDFVHAYYSTSDKHQQSASSSSTNYGYGSSSYGRNTSGYGGAYDGAPGNNTPGGYQTPGNDGSASKSSSVQDTPSKVPLLQSWFGGGSSKSSNIKKFQGMDPESLLQYRDDLYALYPHNLTNLFVTDDSGLMSLSGGLVAEISNRHRENVNSPRGSSTSRSKGSGTGTVGAGVEREGTDRSVFYSTADSGYGYGGGGGYSSGGGNGAAIKYKDDPIPTPSSDHATRPGDLQEAILNLSDDILIKTNFDVHAKLSSEATTRDILSRMSPTDTSTPEDELVLDVDGSIPNSPSKHGNPIGTPASGKASDKSKTSKPAGGLTLPLAGCTTIVTHATAGQCDMYGNKERDHFKVQRSTEAILAAFKRPAPNHKISIIDMVLFVEDLLEVERENHQCNFQRQLLWKARKGVSRLINRWNDKLQRRGQKKSTQKKDEAEMQQMIDPYTTLKTLEDASCFTVEPPWKGSGAEAGKGGNAKGPSSKNTEDAAAKQRNWIPLSGLTENFPELLSKEMPLVEHEKQLELAINLLDEKINRLSLKTGQMRQMVLQLTTPENMPHPVPNTEADRFKFSLSGKMYAEKVLQGDFTGLNVTCRCLLTRRSKYVKELGRVIERFDHFCPWLDNAIGIGNQRVFFVFLGAVVASVAMWCYLCISFFAEIIFNEGLFHFESIFFGESVKKEAHSVLQDFQSIGTSPIIRILILLAATINIFLGGFCCLLFGRQTMLMVVNLTASEFVQPEKYQHIIRRFPNRRVFLWMFSDSSLASMLKNSYAYWTMDVSIDDDVYKNPQLQIAQTGQAQGNSQRQQQMQTMV